MNFNAFLRYARGIGAIMVVERVVTLVLGVFLARSLGVEGYGAYAFGMTTLVLLMIPTKWGQPELLLRETARSSVGQTKYNIRAVRRKSIIVILMLAVVVSAGAISVTAIVGGSTEGFNDVLLWVLFLLPFAAILEFFCSGLRGAGRIMTSALTVTLLPNLLLIFLLFINSRLELVSSHPEDIMKIRVVAAIAIAGLAGWLLVRVAGAPHRDRLASPPLTALFAGGWPFMLLGASSVLMSRSDLFFLGLFGNSRDVAFYSVAFQAAILVDFGLQVSNAITTQEFARLHAAGRKETLQSLAKSSARFTLLIGIICLIMLFFGGEFLIEKLFGAEFISAWPIIIVLAFGKVMGLLFGEPGFILNMSGHEKLTLQIFSATAAANVLLCVMIIPYWGALGAAVASMLSLLIWRFCAWFAVRRRVGISCGIF